jgi:hypothetical protein
MLHQISGKEYPRLLQRYAKLSSDKLDKLESLADQYLEGSIKSSALPLFSGVSLGLVIGSVSSLPALGIMAGSGLVYSALSNAFQRSMNAEYIKDMGMLAPFLKEADLVTYADLVGVEAVLMEISQAYDDRQKVSPTARRLMRKIGHPLQRRTIARYVETLKPEVAEPTTLSPQRSQLIESAQNSTAATHQPSEYYDWGTTYRKKLFCRRCQSRTRPIARLENLPYQPGELWGRGRILLDSCLQVRSGRSCQYHRCQCCDRSDRRRDRLHHRIHQYPRGDSHRR